MRRGRRPRKQGMLNIEDGPGKLGQIPAAWVQPVNEKPILTYPVPEKAGKWPHAWREKLRLNLPFCKSWGCPQESPKPLRLKSEGTINGKITGILNMAEATEPAIRSRKNLRKETFPTARGQDLLYNRIR